jgi:hypothetical protein
MSFEEARKIEKPLRWFAEKAHEDARRSSKEA